MAVSRSGCRYGNRYSRRFLASSPRAGPCVAAACKHTRLCPNVVRTTGRDSAGRSAREEKPGRRLMAELRVLATGLEFPEGPVAMPDGSVVLVEIRGRRLTRVHPDGRKEGVAPSPGGPNGAALGPDGKIYVCNNGGFSWIPTGKMIMPGAQPDDYLGGALLCHGVLGRHGATAGGPA